MKEEDFKFPMFTASDKVIRNRKLVCEVGINDADYVLQPTLEGKVLICPYYQRWRNMIQRGYCLKYKETHPTYKEVTVCDEWLTFSNFKSWMEKQDWKGKQLDKDIILPNNKVYSPEVCVFVPKMVNNLLLNSYASRGIYKQGVYYEKGKGKFSAKGWDNKGKQNNLGTFPTEALAYEAYVNYKHNLILEVAAEQEDHRVRDGLLLHAQILLDTLEDNE